MQLAITAPPMLRSLTVIGSLASFIAKQHEHYTWIEMAKSKACAPGRKPLCVGAWGRTRQKRCLPEER